MWHVFDQMLELFAQLHEQAGQGAIYWNRGPANIFLRFPNNRARLPDVYLCDFEHKPGRDADDNSNGLAVLFITITYLMARRRYDRIDPCATEPRSRPWDCRIVSDQHAAIRKPK